MLVTVSNEEEKRSRERAENGTLCVSYEQDTHAFKEMMRMTPEQFAEILNAIEPYICLVFESF